MKKWVCQVCGYIYEGENPPEECPVCHVGADKFEELKGELTWADEHRIGVAKGVDEEVVEELRANFTGECTEVGMYLAMSRQADREGYPEIAEAYKRIAFEEAEHAAKFAELLGECVVADTKENLRVRVDAEYGATDGKLKLAKRAKELGLDEDIRVGTGEEINTTIMADVFEAFVAAVYLDQGFEFTKKFVLDIIVKYIENEIEFLHDYKSKLQELVQTVKKSIIYEVIDEKGPAHNKTFTSIVKIDGIIMGKGTAGSKKASEQEAAKDALSKEAKVEK